jgi:hypothetical protein
MKTNASSIAVATFLLAATISQGAITGQWDFESGDLSATTGTALSYLDSATQTDTQFGTTTSFGIANVAGQPARVMRFPKMASSSMGYLMVHGAAPNGGGLLVNQWTLIVDVLYPTASSSKWRSITQTDNSGDGDFFVNPGNGIGISSSYAGNVTPNAWHRIVFAVDVSRPQPLVSKYVDGVKAADQVLDSGLDARWALRPEMWFLNDEDAESEVGYINSIQVRDTKLSDALVALLGAPTAAGIPTTELPPHPYVESTSPANGDSAVSPDTGITANIVDGELAVTAGSVQLAFNGSSVVPNVSKVGTITTVSYQPPSPLPAGSTNTVRLIFADSSGNFTNTWTFVVKPLDQKPSITAQWDFDNGDLAATLGAALEYMGGPGGPTESATQFGTTTSFGIPDISGVPARVMRFAGASTPALGYIMRHGAVPNGGGTKVNQWTLIMDILIPHQNDEEWFSFIQIDELQNAGDGDLFANFSGGNAGIGISSSYAGAIAAGQWHRVAFSVDMSGSSPVISKFIDGIKVADQSRTAPQLDGRHSLYPYALLFADNDGESQPAYVNSVQVRNYKMKDIELAALGGPSPYGVPLVSGQWDFDSANLSATIGSDMQYRNPDAFFTQFDTHTIGNQDAQVMNFLGVEAFDGYLIEHGALPNGGGIRVNQYTLIMDIMYPTGSGGFRGLFQTATNNSDDAEIFVSSGNGIGISSQYQGTIVPDTWHRVAFTFDLTKRELGKFIDGSNVLSGPVGSSPGTGPYQYLSSGLDGRFSLDTAALLFADNDGELNGGLVNSIQFRIGVLTPGQIAQLGGPSATGVPANLPVPPRLTYILDFGALVISWPLSYTGYILESSTNLVSWTPVEGVVDNSVAIEMSGSQQFFRLRKP